MSFLPFVEHWVVSEQTEGVHGHLGDARAQIWRVDVSTFQLLQLRVLQPLEGIRRLLCLHKLVEYSVLVGLLARLLIKRNRCQSETLLLGPIKNVLVQPFQLLRVQLLFECHLCVQVVIVSHRLIQEVIDSVASDLLVLPLQIFSPFNLLVIESSGDCFQVFAHVAAQDLLFRVDTIVPDQFFLNSVARHPTLVLADSIHNQVDLVLVKRCARGHRFFQVRYADKKFFRWKQRISERRI